MQRPAKCRESRGSREDHHAERTNTGRGPEVSPDVALVVWLLAPERIEALRRRLMAGRARSSGVREI